MGLIFLWPIFSQLNVRGIQVILAVINGSPLDQSINSRFYILKDFQVLRDSFLLPVWGIGGYNHAMTYVMDIKVPPMIFSMILSCQVHCLAVFSKFWVSDTFITICVYT